jgi:hypothetical protein
MKILVACEESGTVRDAFIAKGHDAMSCDILPTSKPGPHYQGDILDILNDGWDMVIAFPPCTYLSNAGACRLYPRKGELNKERYEKGLEAKEFFMQFINADCEKIAVENPVSSRIFQLPIHTQEIQPYEFGHPFSKKTRLWLKGLPRLVPTNIVEKIGTYLPSGTSRYKGTDKNNGTVSGSVNRSKTFQGIADAMADQWG